MVSGMLPSRARQKSSGIAVLMTITLYAAIGLGALLNPQDSVIWVSTIYTVTAFVMTTTTLLAFASQGSTRLAWTGWAVFGWAYFLLCFRESVFGTLPNLVTTWLIRELNVTGDRSVTHFSNERSFIALMHAVFTMLFAFLGSRLARSLVGDRSTHAAVSRQERESNSGSLQRADGLLGHNENAIR
jgi:hypothetical protein